MENTEKISDLKLINASTQEEIKVSSLWAENGVVIYFLRRFGCPVCRWISKELNQIKSVLESNNFKLVGVGPEKLGSEDFIKGNFWNGDLYIDDNKSMYKTIGFSRFSMMGALGAAIDKETRNINSQAGKVGITGNLKGDKLQLGGLLIVEKGGKVLKYYKQVKASDYLKNSEILEVLGITADKDDNVRPDMAIPE